MHIHYWPNDLNYIYLYLLKILIPDYNVLSNVHVKNEYEFVDKYYSLYPLLPQDAYPIDILNG